MTSWFTHVRVDEAVQGRSSISSSCSCLNTTAVNRQVIVAALEPGALRGPWKKLTSFHCSQVVDPDIDERINQVQLSAGAIVPVKESPRNSSLGHFLGMPQIECKTCTGFTAGTNYCLVSIRHSRR